MVLLFLTNSKIMETPTILTPLICKSNKAPETESYRAHIQVNWAASILLPDEVMVKTLKSSGDACHSDVPSGGVFFMRWVHLNKQTFFEDR